ncbi:WD40 repeat domain-containing protein [Anatilimnocola sp. NA78]|uniref:WD40 repeat domain-containing protein n=1 Tax=Anatilimnocola sp. NA78 TaxID=3415683 RepID=UPI003CE4EAFE
MIETPELLKKYQPKQFKVIDADPQISSARFSPCGKVLVAGGYDAKLHRWNFQTEEFTVLSPLDGHHGWIEGFAFSPGGEQLFSGDSWGKLVCWNDIAGEKPTEKWQNDKAHDGWIRELTLSADGQLLASVATDHKLKIWSTADGSLKHELPIVEDPRAVRFHPDGSLLVGDAKGIVHWLKVDGTVIKTFDGSILFTLSRLQDCGGVQCLAFDKEAKTLAVGGTLPKNGGTVVGVPTLLLFDLATGKQTHKFDLGDGQDVFVADLRFHDEGFLSLVTYGTPGKGQLLYVRPEEKAPFFIEKKLANPHSLSWHPDGKRFAVAATNAGSNGNGRPIGKDGKYLGNKSPIHLFAIPT